MAETDRRARLNIFGPDLSSKKLVSITALSFSKSKLPQISKLYYPSGESEQTVSSGQKLWILQHGDLSLSHSGADATNEYPLLATMCAVWYGRLSVLYIASVPLGWITNLTLLRSSAISCIKRSLRGYRGHWE